MRRGVCDPAIAKDKHCHRTVTCGILVSSLSRWGGGRDYCWEVSDERSAIAETAVIERRERMIP